MAINPLLSLLEWLAIRAGARLGADAGQPWKGSSTADRAGELVPAPQEVMEPEVGRSLLHHWALWLAVLVVLALLARGYIRRRLRPKGDRRPILNWRGRR